jgi:ERCC4-type nuclease
VLASIHDGRWQEQKLRILRRALDQSASPPQFLYIIELGQLLWEQAFLANDLSLLYPFSNVSVDAGFNAITNLLVIYKIPFLFVRDTSMTCDMVERMTKQVLKQRTDEGYSISESYEKALLKSSFTTNSKRKDNFTPDTYYLHILMGIPSVSYKTATQFRDLFPTFSDFIKAISTHSVDEFQKIWKNRVGRRINQSVITFIYDFYK